MLPLEAAEDFSFCRSADKEEDMSLDVRPLPVVPNISIVWFDKLFAGCVDVEVESHNKEVML